MLMIISMLTGQKPAIDLLPSSHQYKHPAAIVDTSSANDTLTGIIFLQRPQTIDTDTLKTETEKKNHFQFGLNLDSIFKNGEFRKIQKGKSSGLFPKQIKIINPIKLFIFITALN